MAEGGLHRGSKSTQKEGMWYVACRILATNTGRDDGASPSSQVLLSTCWLLAALNELHVAEKQAGCLTPANMTIG